MRILAVFSCVLAALGMTLGTASSEAAESYKCKDARGGIVYSNETCEKQGLVDAGPVRERLMTVPATSPTGKPPLKEEKKRSEKDEKPAR